MGEQQVQYFKKLFGETQWPEYHRDTQEAKKAYERAQDIVYTFRGDSEVLNNALRAFIAMGSRAYAFAGAASIMAMASYMSSGDYYQAGLEEALRWLRNAREVDTGIPEFRLIEARINLDMKQLEDARSTLDELEQSGYMSYRLCSIEMYYWDRKGDLEPYLRWYKQAYALAENEDKRMHVMEQLASYYLMHNMYDDSLKLYGQIVNARPQNSWAWHNMSLMHYRQGNYQKAREYNQKALSIRDFGAARWVEEKLNSKDPKPPNTKPPATKKPGFFDRLRGKK